ncbi:hypothetical protein GN244_ATG12768 [Phytophthora infestans]|uniref:Secreted RxLR effector peptide protein n=1 Tax=Phytophthora infestans TaxID=4787 RepID=A0A833T1A0_PHYIN|nr:hypothetical protein GN244_ATG12768 [Phytophthora infestans]
MQLLYVSSAVLAVIVPIRALRRTRRRCEGETAHHNPLHPAINLGGANGELRFGLVAEIEAPQMIYEVGEADQTAILAIAAVARELAGAGRWKQQ